MNLRDSMMQNGTHIIVKVFDEKYQNTTITFADLNFVFQNGHFIGGKGILRFLEAAGIKHEVLTTTTAETIEKGAELGLIAGR